MSRLLFIYIILFGLTTCAHPKEESVSESSIQPAVDSITSNSANKIMDAQTGYWIQEMRVENIDMQFCLDKQGDTVKLWTIDQSFISPEGFKLGITWKELPVNLQEQLREESGWGIMLIWIQAGCSDFVRELHVQITHQ
ncbi:hypothetical protein GXP67_25305 [Rhodocytophaga rosea]|uniref:Uncharacterized protein n=1 Tax=Rhodocytophaga rosea TaxID=2704465 RepID=A0A6C0GNX5_9BACT|nr:hypothetical protein [Rhodocytophaga rosea]QHT69726.1 hypothetical protein GXP67_25305 [Rhodocytophaga rosea]